jgi:hypothetical protein
MRRSFKVILWVVLGLLLVGATSFVVWAEATPAPMQPALDALVSSPTMQVTTDEWLVFRPLSDASETPVTTGFIFYPGGRVDARSYAPYARAIAEAGFLVVITPVPLNLAVFAPNQADEVMAAFPEITHWAVGGHSLGGAMAANYIFNHQEMVDGLVLWAAYPAGNNTLVDYAGAITSIFGTLDGLATVENIDTSRPLLPAQTVYVPIKGGNHGQFGWYGDQPGDNPATISREVQQAQTVAATVALLAGLK